MSHLPIEIIRDIFSRLLVKSLLRFLCVFKQWYALIKHPNFLKLHLYRSIETNRDCTLIFSKTYKYKAYSVVPRYFFSVHFPSENHFDKGSKLHQPLYHRRRSIRILDYCHGLVCIYHKTQEIMIWNPLNAIWNPLIRKYKILPREQILKPSNLKNGNESTHIAFGYDLCNGDYKVLRVTTFHNILGQPLGEFEVKVYSLRSDSWRKIKDQWPKKECKISSTSASLNGLLHWLVAEDISYDMHHWMGLVCLLAFDLATEKFRVFKTPVQQKIDLETGLEVLKGQLCFIELTDAYNDVWLMKEYGEASFWTRIYKIGRGLGPRSFSYCKPLMFSENEKKILLEMCHLKHTKLVWNEIEKNMRESVKIQNLPDSLRKFRTATCVGSLLLLDGHNVIDLAE